ncbi:cell surface glycoprotein CD200 receptor 1-B isoform X2 [Mastacembelus armatus]|uniref:cell surface glycoprotein CD200 receptor 1-B isoform X2 n=1 Tax=Mastacembelus armatus TaxID=205130 RepID=UPI000E45925D|nr:cell surface glycoprotein CD200 receptor 1 isoform X2 [Mastacembelus armatus]
MRDMMWIYAMITLLWSEAWSQDTVDRYSSFNLGSDGNLTCSDKTWNNMIYVIWNIEMKSKTCKIGFDNGGQITDNCTDGKSLRNTSSFQSYLHIPNFSEADEGTYRCESVYTGGSENYAIDVKKIAPPSISAWLEYKDNKMVAVCKAERSTPAANISWDHSEESMTLKTKSSDGFITVESRLELPKGMDTKNLTCTISHPYWEEERIIRPALQKGYYPWLFLLIILVFVVVVGPLFLLRKKVMLRQSRQSDTSSSKSPPTEDVEEVEPYASYVQRVNSIYNSSADCSYKNPAHAHTPKCT